MKVKQTQHAITAVLLIAVAVFFDQWTKQLAVRYLKDSAAIPVWKGVFELKYLENKGAAFGILQNQQYFFYLTTGVMLILFLLLLYRLSSLIAAASTRSYIGLFYLVSILCAGAIGNLIDRVQHQYVVDFLYFKLIDFPIFNVADCYVTVSMFGILLTVMFWMKDEEFSRIISLRRKK